MIENGARAERRIRPPKVIGTGTPRWGKHTNSEALGRSEGVGMWRILDIGFKTASSLHEESTGCAGDSSWR
jgi:hypothetical protein